MAAVSSNVGLAHALPPRLLAFFKRFPPPQLSTTASQSTVQIASNTSSSDPNDTTISTSTPSEPSLEAGNSTFAQKKNPFLPFKNPSTGNWHGPHYSLRRQAELFKLAKQHHVLPLMPISPKHPEVKEQKRIEHGLRVKGTGEGQRVKGKHWERTLKSRLETRRRAMEVMPDMINIWRERGHGRGWKKYPSGKPSGEGVFDPGMRHAWVHERPPPAA